MKTIDCIYYTRRVKCRMRAGRNWDFHRELQGIGRSRLHKLLPDPKRDGHPGATIPSAHRGDRDIHMPSLRCDAHKSFHLAVFGVKRRRGVSLRFRRGGAAMCSPAVVFGSRRRGRPVYPAGSFSACVHLKNLPYTKYACVFSIFADEKTARHAAHFGPSAGCLSFFSIFRRVRRFLTTIS